MLCRYSILIPRAPSVLDHLAMLLTFKVSISIEVVSYGVSIVCPCPDDCLVLRHRRPISLPFPNTYSHPLPRFSYNQETAEIHVEFLCDPSFPPPSARNSGSWKRKVYLLASIPLRKPRTILDDATQFISSTFAAPLALFSGKSSPQATPEDVSQNGVDLNEDEVLEEERGEEAEVDDSPELSRSVRVLSIANTVEDDEHLVDKARNRRRWQVIPLRTVNARTAA